MAAAWVEMAGATASMATRIEILIAVVRHGDCFIKLLVLVFDDGVRVGFQGVHQVSRLLSN